MTMYPKNQISRPILTELEELPSNLEQQEAYHESRKNIMAALAILKSMSEFSSDIHTLEVLEMKTLSVFKQRVTELMKKQEEKDNESPKTGNRSMDFVWPGEQAGFDALDSQLSELSGKRNSSK